MPVPATEIGDLARVVADAIDERARARLVAAGFDDVRDPHGSVVRGLVAGDTTITQLALRLGVSAQAVSKTVTDLERNGYVRRGHDPHDKRARPLLLTRRGDQLVDASRRAHQAVARELSRWLGTRDTAELVRLLQHASELFEDGQTDKRIGIRL